MSYVDDEHRANGTALFSNPKNRENPGFKEFRVCVDWKCRLLHEPDGDGEGGAGISVDDGTLLGAL